IQPGRRLGAERGEPCVTSLSPECGEGGPQLLLAREITVRGLEQPLFQQAIDADEHRIAREGGLRAVRGITEPRWSYRQHLPAALAGVGEEIDETTRLWPNGPAFGRTGQAGRVKEPTARAVVELR